MSGSPNRRYLVVIGAIGLVASAFVAIAGWALISTITTGGADTIGSASVAVKDVGSATEAAAQAVASMRRVVEDIEGTARSTGMTLSTVADLVAEVGDQAEGNVAQSLESAVDAMPGIIQTGRGIDRTLRALSLVGLDYEPETPLDEALESLRDSLAPLADEIRDQAQLLDVAAEDLIGIGNDARSLATRLLVIRLELADAEQVVMTAAADISTVSSTMEALERDLDGYRRWAPWVAVALALATAAGSAGVLLLGLSQERIRQGT